MYIFFLSIEIGGDLFLIGCVAALIFIVSPASFDRVTVLRDMVFFLITCVWLALSFVDEHFTYFEAVGKDERY